MKNLLWALVFLLPTITYSQSYETIWCDLDPAIMDGYQDTFCVTIRVSAFINLDSFIEDSKKVHKETNVPIEESHALYFHQHKEDGYTRVVKIYFGRLKKGFVVWE